MDEPHLSSLLDFLVRLPPVSGQRVRLYSALGPVRPVDDLGLARRTSSSVRGQDSGRLTVLTLVLFQTRLRDELSSSVTMWRAAVNAA